MSERQLVLPMSLCLFERECHRMIDSLPADDPLADHDVRKFAEQALLLCREYQAYREGRAKDR